MLEPCIIDWAAHRSEVALLRVNVWKPLASPGMPGLLLDELNESLDYHDGTVHLADFDGPAVIGALRLTMDYVPESVKNLGIADGSGNALISRLVVSESHRRKGVAKSLISKAIKICVENSQRGLWVEATHTTAEPLIRMGFEKRSEYDEEEAIFVKQHITIVCRNLL